MNFFSINESPVKSLLRKIINILKIIRGIDKKRIIFSGFFVVGIFLLNSLALIITGFKTNRKVSWKNQGPSPIRS